MLTTLTAVNSDFVLTRLHTRSKRATNRFAIRGDLVQATAEDLEGPAQRGPQAREGWMTDLPPERQATTKAPSGNQTSFSMQGIRSRGDTSDWTMTPAQRLLQLQVSLLVMQPSPHNLFGFFWFLLILQDCQKWLEVVSLPLHVRRQS